MPQGKGTYGSKVGRPPKKKTSKKGVRTYQGKPIGNKKLTTVVKAMRKARNR